MLHCDELGKEASDVTLRRERDAITGLPLNSDGDEMLAVDGPSNCCTVYATVPRPLGATAPALVVRVNLFAELFGSRALVASAFLRPGFTGACIVVTGMHVDGWHVTFAASRSDTDLRAGIQAARGCSGFQVAVPAVLQSPPAGTPPALTGGPAMPWKPLEGIERIATLEGGLVVTLNEFERVRAITVTAGAVDATIAIVDGSGPFPLITVPAGTTVTYDFDGRIRGPGTITFAGPPDAFTVEITR